MTIFCAELFGWYKKKFFFTLLNSFSPLKAMTKKESEDFVLRAIDRYISVEGDYIDSLGKQSESLVPSEAIENRKRRDGDEYHITIVNPIEISRIIKEKQKNDDHDKELSNKQRKRLQYKELQKIYNSILDLFGDPSDWQKPVDLGLGSCKNDQAVSFYKIVYWPLGQTIREFLGLQPIHFHITIGFTPKDVYLYKGPGSLLCLQEDQLCDVATMNVLITYVQLYSEDKDFLLSLYKTCVRHGLSTDRSELTTLLTFMNIPINV